MGQQQDQGSNKRHLDSNEYENTTIKNLWDTQKAILTEIHSIIGLSQKTRESSNKQSNFTCKGTWKRRINKAQRYMSIRKEIIKIRTEINEIESKKMILNINESKSFSLKQ